MNEIIVRSSLSAFTDHQLYKLCQLYGGNAKSWLRKFAGLLPEVYKRRLHRKHGCASIQEFAKKLAGMNEATVDKILNLHRKLQNKPALMALLESGEQGWSKLEKVAYMATPETDKELAKKVETLPQKALELYVQNIRDKSGEFTLKSETQNIFQISQGADQNGQQTSLQAPGQPGLQQNIFQIESIPQEQTFMEPTEQHFVSAPYTTFSFPISPTSHQKLNFIKNQLEKDYKKTLTWDEVIKFWPLKTQKTIIQKVCPKCAESASKKTNASRHIPTAVKKLISPGTEKNALIPTARSPIMNCITQNPMPYTKITTQTIFIRFAKLITYSRMPALLQTKI